MRRPRRPSRPRRSEWRRSRGDTPSWRSRDGTVTRRPSVVTTTATARRSRFSKRPNAATPARPPCGGSGECSRISGMVQRQDGATTPTATLRPGGGSWIRHPGLPLPLAHQCASSGRRRAAHPATRGVSGPATHRRPKSGTWLCRSGREAALRGAIVGVRPVPSWPPGWRPSEASGSLDRASVGRAPPSRRQSRCVRGNRQAAASTPCCVLRTERTCLTPAHPADRPERCPARSERTRRGL